MVSESSIGNQRLKRTVRRRHSQGYVVIHVSSGVVFSVELFWNYRKARSYRRDLIKKMGHPDDDDVVIFSVEFPRP